MKFKIGQTIYYNISGKIYSAPVLSRMMIENVYETIDMNNEQQEIFTPFGPSIIVYSTIHGQFEENQCFESEDLKWV